MGAALSNAGALLAAAWVCGTLVSCAVVGGVGPGVGPAVPVGKDLVATGPIALTAAPEPAVPAPVAAARPAGPVPPVPGVPTPANAGRPPPPAAPATPPPPAAAVPPGPLKPYAEIVKDAREFPGFLTVWQKDEKLWLEVRPEQLEQPFFLGAALASGLGERRILPGLMVEDQMVVLRRVNNQVQLVARNLHVRAPADTPLALAVRESYSDSLLASASVVSTPHAERHSFLVDAIPLLFNDIPGLQARLEEAFRMSYGYDARNSSVERIRSAQTGTSITLRQHFSVPRLPTSPAFGAMSGAMLPSPPRALADPRSFFLNVTLNFLPLAETPMRLRPADQRVGHFTESFTDLGVPAGDDSRTHVIRRWRLEKKDPAAAVSEPKAPIVVWMDHNIPEAYRPAVRAGIVEWNLAFERAGFKDALDVRQQPADADWSTIEGTRHVAVRWFAMEGPGAMAVGPSQADPRSGEIINAAVIIPENWARIGRTEVSEVLPPPVAGMRDARGAAGPVPAPLQSTAISGALCEYAVDAVEQVAFGLDLLEARGTLDPNGPEAERFIEASLKDVVMHEVGHALGLRHNFRASASVPMESLRDPEWVHRNGVASSVMDYSPLNLPLDNEPRTEYHQTTLGAYDYWAIEYAYRELPPETEVADLRRIAERSRTEPALGYATDEDMSASYGGGIDPLINVFDLGDDPLAFYARRFALSTELWRRTERRVLVSGENYALYRRALVRGLNQIAAVTPLIAKYVGGVLTSREVPGGTSELLAPVPMLKQRAALDLLAREVFSSDSFRFDPRFMSRLGVDHLERASGEGSRAAPDYSLATSVLSIQRLALDALMSEATAVRLADAETLVGDPRAVLSLAAVHQRLLESIWSELRGGRHIGGQRRNLQREHARRLAAALVRPASGAAADSRAVQRAVAVQLEARVRAALASGRFDGTARAHLAESQAQLAEALKAGLLQQGV